VSAPTLINHHDCDGVWSPQDAASLLDELSIVEETLTQYPAVEFNSPWKKQVAKSFGIAPKNLAECFFDVDGEPLVSRLRELVEVSLNREIPILFQ
jgi:hypothetical protein